MSNYVWNNMAFNSEDEMRLAQEIPSVYLDRWNDSGHVAEAILASDWLADHDREVAARAWDELYASQFDGVSTWNADTLHDPNNPYRVADQNGDK